LGAEFLKAAMSNNEEPHRRADGLSKQICSWGFAPHCKSQIPPQGDGEFTPTRLN
jgi:hypothetical protein